MIESKSFGSKAFKVINAIILILLAFSCFYPLWYTFCVSISSKAAAEGGLVTVYPIEALQVLFCGSLSKLSVCFPAFSHFRYSAKKSYCVS